MKIFCLYFLSFTIIISLVNPPFVFGQYQSVDSQALAQLSLEDAIKMRTEGRLVEAERHIQDALQEFPENKDYQFELSNIYAAYHDDLAQSKKKTEASQMLWKVSHVLDRTVMLDPSFIPAQYNLAVIYKRLGEYERARDSMRKVIIQAQEQGQPHVEFNALLQMGAIYQEQGFFYEAGEMYQKARELNFYHPEVQGAIDDLKREEQKFNEMKTRQDMLEGLGSSQTFFSPYSHAATQINRDPSLGGVGQAIPFVGMLLAEQFLNRLGRREKV